MAERLIFYSAHAKQIEGSVGAKIQAILEQNAIEYNKENKVFLCHPILQKDGKPYNSTTYTLKKEGDSFTCDCQGFVTKERKYKISPETEHKPGCSHIAALHEYLKRNHIRRREEKVGQAMLALFGND